MNPRPPAWSAEPRHDDGSGLWPERGEAAPGAWRADQLFVHGLLRALNTADAAARTARIDNILSCLEAAGRRPVRVGALALVAASLLAVIAWPLLASAQLPEAQAAVLRGVALLADGGDRQFVVESTHVDNAGRVLPKQTFELLARPGRHFVVSGALTMGPLHFADMRFGCDGADFWFHSQEGGAEGRQVQRSGPLDQAPSLLRGIGNVLDLGLLDVHAVVQQLPQDFTLRTCSRSVDQDGRSLVHVEATGGPVRPGFRLHRADLFCEEATGMIVRLEVEADDGLGRTLRMSFRHQGVVAVDHAVYQRPW